MAKSKRKRRMEARDKKDARKILTVVGVSTLIFLILLFFLFQNS